MVSNRLALAALAFACIGAAGAGGYLATRHNVAGMAAPDAAAASPSPSAIVPKPVQETEATVSDPTKPAPATTEPPATSTAPVTSTPPRRRESASAAR